MSAETKKAVDYRVKVQISKEGIMQASCECPAGNGLSVSCYF